MIAFMTWQNDDLQDRQFPGSQERRRLPIFPLLRFMHLDLHEQERAKELNDVPPQFVVLSHCVICQPLRAPRNNCIYVSRARPIDDA